MFLWISLTWGYELLASGRPHCGQVVACGESFRPQSGHGIKSEPVEGDDAEFFFSIKTTKTTTPAAIGTKQIRPRMSISQVEMPNMTMPFVVIREGFEQPGCTSRCSIVPQQPRPAKPTVENSVTVGQVSNLPVLVLQAPVAFTRLLASRG